MSAVVLVHLSLLGILAGVMFLVWPLKFPGIRSRRAAALLLVFSVVTLMVGTALPASESHVPSPQSELDRFMPAYHFHEVHSVRISASRERAYAALKEVTAEEIFLYRTLVWLRRLGRSGPPSILNPPPHQSLLEVAGKTSFLPLADLNGQEIVLGTLVAVPHGWRPSGPPTVEGYMSLANSGRPGFAFAAINFRFESCAPPSGAAACTLVTTETRVYANDAASRRSFAPYWRVIYPGSSFIRMVWLRAVARRAETT